MVRQLWQRLATDFPEFVELQDLLRLAEKTWPRFGLSAEALAGLDETTLEMVRLWVTGGD